MHLCQTQIESLPEVALIPYSIYGGALLEARAIKSLTRKVLLPKSLYHLGKIR